METVLASREGKPKFGGKPGRMNPFASTTNREKKKGKSYMMLKHKYRGKKKLSFQEKQKRLRDSLLKKQKKIMK